MLPAPIAQPQRAARAVYDRLSRWYDVLAEGSEGPLRDRALALLDPRPGETLLEIGCGAGRAVAAMAQAVGPTGRVCGLDLSRGMLRQSRARLARVGLSQAAALIEGDGVALPFAPGAFHAAFLAFALELFDAPDIARVLAECRRVLRAQGRLCIVALAEGAGPMVRLYTALHARFPFAIDCRPIPLRQIVESAGFAIAQAARTSMWGLPVETALAYSQGAGGLP